MGPRSHCKRFHLNCDKHDCDNKFAKELRNFLTHNKIMNSAVYILWNVRRYQTSDFM